MSSDADFKFIAVLKQLGLRLKLDSFESRLLLQKKMYLLQRCGLDLNLRYGWYIRGPYSTDLSHMAYRLEPVLDDERIDKILPTLSSAEKKQLSCAKKLFATIDRLGDDKEYWYELVGSIAFLQESNQLKTENALFTFLEKKKPDRFKKADIKKARRIVETI